MIAKWLFKTTPDVNLSACPDILLHPKFALFCDSSPWDCMCVVCGVRWRSATYCCEPKVLLYGPDWRQISPPENLQKYGCCFHSWGEQCNLCRLNWELNCVCSGYVIAVPRNRSERFPLEDKKKACVMQIPHTWFQFRLELSASGTDLTDGTHTHTKKNHNVGFSGWQKRQWLNLVTQEGQNQAGMWQSHVTKMWEVLILSCLTAKFQR